MTFLKHHLSTILIVLLALLAIVLVLWVFEKRLRRIDAKMKTTALIQPRPNYQEVQCHL